MYLSDVSDSSLDGRSHMLLSTVRSKSSSRPITYKLNTLRREKLTRCSDFAVWHSVLCQPQASCAITIPSLATTTVLHQSLQGALNPPWNGTQRCWRPNSPLFGPWQTHTLWTRTCWCWIHTWHSATWLQFRNKLFNREVSYKFVTIIGRAAIHCGLKVKWVWSTFSNMICTWTLLW